MWFLATVNRIAEILRLQGDLDSADVRRSKAIGILAQPALALDLLWQFRDEQQPAAEPQQPDEPVDNHPRAPFDRSTCGPTDDLLPDSLVVRPSGLDQRRLRPQVVLHIHLSQEALLAGVANGAGRPGASGLGGGVARIEGVGPVTLEQVRRFLGQTSCKVTVRPVIDPVDVSAVDGYEIPRRIKEAMFLRMPASCFPYAAGARRMDLDHTKPYLPPARGGPPGQAPGYTIWGRSAVPSTASRPIADGDCDNLSLVSGYGDHRTALITWLPPPALTTWVREHSGVPSGARHPDRLGSR